MQDPFRTLRPRAELPYKLPRIELAAFRSGSLPDTTAAKTADKLDPDTTILQMPPPDDALCTIGGGVVLSTTSSIECTGWWCRRIFAEHIDWKAAAADDADDLDGTLHRVTSDGLALGFVPPSCEDGCAVDWHGSAMFIGRTENRDGVWFSVWFWW